MAVHGNQFVITISARTAEAFGFHSDDAPYQALFRQVHTEPPCLLHVQTREGRCLTLTARQAANVTHLLPGQRFPAQIVR